MLKHRNKQLRKLFVLSPLIHFPIVTTGFAATELQVNTENSVRQECTQLPRANGLTAVQQDLDTRCSDIVGTVNGNQGNLAGVEDTLQQIATEEASAAGTLATQETATHTGKILNHINTLRYAGKALGGGAGDEENGFNKNSSFFNVTLGTGDKDGTDRENAFDFDAKGVILGIDHRLRDDMVIGVAVNYNRFDSDFDSNNAGTVLGGNLDADSVGISAYGSWYKDDFYLDGALTYNKSDYELNRVIRYTESNGNVINRIAQGDTDGDQFGVSFGAGLNKQRGALTYGPYGRIHHQSIDIDGYAETGNTEDGTSTSGLNMTVSDQSIDSTRSTVGFHIASAKSQSFGVLSPYANVEWHHEFDDDSREISSHFTADPNQTPFTVRTDSPDRDYFTIDGGISIVYARGIQTFLNASVLLGQDDIDSHYSVTGGVRIEF